MGFQKVDLVLLILQLFDSISTYIAITHYGYSELNTIVLYSFRQIGITWTLGIKIIIILGLIYLHSRLPRLQQAFLLSFTLGNIITAFVCLLNLSLILLRL